MTRINSLSIAIFFVLSGLAYPELAVDRSGKIFEGRLEKNAGAWDFRSETAGALAIGQIAYVRFDTQPARAPRVPLLHRLLLPHDQQIAGVLQNVDESNVSFITSWGQTLVVPREKLVGIAQAEDAVVLQHDDFEIDLKAWTLEGKPALSQTHALHGKSSLMLNAAGQRATRTWQPVLRDGSVRVFFFVPEQPLELSWTFEIILDSVRDAMPALAIDRDGCRCLNVKKNWGRFTPSSGWHLLAVELRGERLRIFVDDYCLGEEPFLPKDGVRGLRFSLEAAKTVKADAGLWIDELIVSRRVPTLPRPPFDKKQDSLLLEHGEQLFGRIVSATTRSITLDAKFGKRTLPWSQVRGIFFAQPHATPDLREPEISFRPGPGFPLDRIRAKLLRWEKSKLLVRHDLLGEIDLERTCLDKVHFEAK